MNVSGYGRTPATSGGDVGTALQRARHERHWSKTRLIHELRRRASARQAALPTTESLSRMIAAWENGQRDPSELYRELLCEVYGEPRLALGLAAHTTTAPEPAPQLAAMVLAARSISAEVVVTLQDQTDRLRLRDRRLGAPGVLDELHAHVANLQHLLQHALVPGIRAPLAAVLADAATLAAWQALDAGRPLEAWSLYETGRGAALEAGSPALLAHAMGEQAVALIDTGQPALAVELVRTAQQVRGPLPQLLVAWLAAAEGEACAAAGWELDSRRALDAAARLLPANCDDPELPFLALNEAHLARWRGHCLARLGIAEAVNDLEAALPRVRGEFTRASASLLCDLAIALRYEGQREEADKRARAAAVLAEQAGSVRQQRRIARLLAA